MNKAGLVSRVGVVDKGEGSKTFAPKSPWHKEFANRMMRAISEAGYKSKEEVGKASGLGRQTIYRWTLGNAMPDPEKLERLAETVGKPFAWFYDLRDEMMPRAEVEERIRNLAAHQASGIVAAMFIDVMRGVDLAAAWTEHSEAAEMMGERELAMTSAASDTIRQGIRQRFPDFDSWSPAQKRRALQVLFDELDQKK